MPLDVRILSLGFASITTLYVGHSTAQTVNVSSQELAKMMDHLTKVNADRSFVRRVLKNGNGRHIDCVDFEEQPGVRSLKKIGAYQKIDVSQFKAPTTSFPAGFQEAQPEPMFDENDTIPSDIWSSEARSKAQICAPGTVPIIRKEVSELTKYSTLEEYLQNQSVSVTTNSLRHYDGPGTGHWHAGVRQDTTNYGAFGSFNLWSPTIRDPSNQDGFSLAEISLGSTYTPGTSGPPHTLELVFKKSPYEYGDQNIHIELCATKNTYTDACINGECASYIGFVQYGSIPIGSSIGPSSAYQGTQYYANFQIIRVGGLPLLITNWLLMLGSTVIGTVPAVMYYNANGNSDLAWNSPRVHLYGETYSTTPLTPSSNDMGSGQFANYAPTSGWDGFGQYAWISQMKYWPYSNSPTVTTPINSGYIETDNPNCYNAAYANNPDVYNWYIYYGGPGAPNGGYCNCSTKYVNNCPAVQ